MAYLSIADLRKSFGDNLVLNGISMDIQQGEVVSIIGGSGNGKTTFLRCLADLETPDSGQIILKDRQIFPKEKSDERAPIGFVFQNFNLFPQYTTLENITLALDNQKPADGVSRKEQKEKNKEAALELLSQMKLLDKKDQYPCELSGGQKQRVAIARALALKPELLLFDEPTSALDPKITKQMADVIREIKKENTIIVVTHDMEFAKMISDRIYFMNAGVIAFTGTTEEVFSSEDPALLEFLGTIREEDEE